MLYKRIGNSADKISCLNEAKESWLMALEDDSWTLHWMRIAARELEDEVLYKELQKVKPRSNKDDNNSSNGGAHRPIARK